MIFKTAVQKDRLPFQFEGAATSFGGTCPPQLSYVPAGEVSFGERLTRQRSVSNVVEEWQPPELKVVPTLCAVIVTPCHELLMQETTRKYGI